MEHWMDGQMERLLDGQTSYRDAWTHLKTRRQNRKLVKQLVNFSVNVGLIIVHCTLKKNHLFPLPSSLKIAKSMSL